MYFFSLPGIFKASIVTSADFFKIRGRVFFVPFTYDPFLRKTDHEKKKKEADKPAKKKKAEKTKKSGKISGNLRLMKNMMGSFSIRRLELNIDTDDFILNAWLIPVFSAVNSNNIQLRANFEGHTTFLFDMRFRLGALLWIYVINKIRS